MAIKSVYLPEPAISKDIITVTDEEHRHLLVARAEPGERVEVFDGRGRVWRSVVVEVSKRQTLLRREEELQIAPPKIELILGLALVQRAAFEFALEKAVEVGITRIIPFVAARSNVGRIERQDRWQRIVVEAAKQAKRFHLPVLDEPTKFADVLRISAASKIFFSEGGPLKGALTGAPVLYLIGPEGGWSSDELKAVSDAGFRAVSLGSGILRTETAATVAAALIRYELGDM